MRRVVDGRVHVRYGQAYVLAGGPNPELPEAFAGQENGLCGAAVPGSLFLITGLHTGDVGFAYWHRTARQRSGLVRPSLMVRLRSAVSARLPSRP